MLKIIFILLFLVNNACATELKVISAEAFIVENPSKERKEIIDYILNQFEGKSVTQADLDLLWNDEKAKEDLHFSRFQIINQKLYAAGFDETHPYFRSLIQYFVKLLNKYQIPDVDFIVHTNDQLRKEGEDENSVKKIQNIPTFMMFKDLADPYESTRLLLPDAFFLWDSWGPLLQKIKAQSKKIKWNDKQEKMFWRGGTTGNATLSYNLKNFSKLPRLSLVMLSKLYPEKIDARFTYYMEGVFDQDKNGELEQILKILFNGASDNVKEIDHLKYKYLLSLDGHNATGTRVPWIMYSNSVLVKQETQKIEWFYSVIKPYVHYVPINERLTDIFKQFEWMKTHDQELQQISQNAHDFVQNELLPEHIEAHMVLILNKYHEIQKDKKIQPTLPTAEETRSFTEQAIAVVKKIKRIFIYWVQNIL